MAITTWLDTTGDWDDSKFSRPWDGPNLTPDKGSLTLSSSIPISSSSYFITPGNASLEFIQTYDWTNVPLTWGTADWAWNQSPIIPSLSIGKFMTPSGATFTFTATVPTVDEIHHTVIPVGSLTITGYSPSKVSGHLIEPGVAQLTGLGTISWADTSGDWASSSDTWGTGTVSPTVGVTYNFTIDSAGNIVLTPYDPQWPLVGDPNYVAEIIIS